MTTLFKQTSHLRAAFIAILIALMLPLATLADSPRRGDDDNWGRNRRRAVHMQLHRAKAGKHLRYLRYKRLKSRRDWIRYQMFLRYLRAKRMHELRRMRSDNWRQFARNRR